MNTVRVAPVRVMPPVAETTNFKSSSVNDEAKA